MGEDRVDFAFRARPEMASSANRERARRRVRPGEPERIGNLREKFCGPPDATDHVRSDFSALGMFLLLDQRFSTSALQSCELWMLFMQRGLGFSLCRKNKAVRFRPF